MLATKAVANAGPTPGIASSRLLTTELAIAFERRDEAVLDWIDAAVEDDWDRRRGCL